jgi:hypothetical protein
MRVSIAAQKGGGKNLAVIPGVFRGQSAGIARKVFRRGDLDSTGFERFFCSVIPADFQLTLRLQT